MTLSWRKSIAKEKTNYNEVMNNSEQIETIRIKENNFSTISIMVDKTTEKIPSHFKCKEFTML